MSQLELYTGEAVLSLNQLDRKLKGIQKICNRVDALHTQYIYLLEFERAPNETEKTQLEALLRTSDTGLIKTIPSSLILFHSPSFEKLTGWATNFKKLLTDCGLHFIKRVERAAYFCLELTGDLLTTELKQIEILLHQEELIAWDSDIELVKTRFLLKAHEQAEQSAFQAFKKFEIQSEQDTQKLLTTNWCIDGEIQPSFQEAFKYLKPNDAFIDWRGDFGARFAIGPLSYLNTESTVDYQLTTHPAYIATQSLQKTVQAYPHVYLSLDFGMGMVPVACVSGLYLQQGETSNVNMGSCEYISPQAMLAKFPERQGRYFSEIGLANVAGFVRLQNQFSTSFQVQQYGIQHDVSHLMKAKESFELLFYLLPKEQMHAYRAVINHCNLLGDNNPIWQIEHCANGDLIFNVLKNAQQQFEYYLYRENCIPVILESEAEKQQLLQKREASLSLSSVFAVSSEQSLAFPAKENTLETVPSLFEIEVGPLLKAVLAHPSVADKRYLIHHFDRSVGGLITRDQLVGHWQEPVADVGVALLSFEEYKGMAMAVGECALTVLHNDPETAIKRAFAEALTNLYAADIREAKAIKLAIYLGMTLEPRTSQAYRLLMGFIESVKNQLGIETLVIYPSAANMLISPQTENELSSFSIHAQGYVEDVRNTFNPALKLHMGETELVYLDLTKSPGLGGSIASECLQAHYENIPDVNFYGLAGLCPALTLLRSKGWVLAYHDCSDGGMITTLCEMAFAAHCGLDIQLSDQHKEVITPLFSEGPGAVIQVRAEDVDEVIMALASHHIDAYVIAKTNNDDIIRIFHGDAQIVEEKRVDLQRAWSKTSYKFSREAVGAELAQSEFNALFDPDDPGLTARLSFDIEEDITLPYLNKGVSPKVAILESTCTTGKNELAAAFHQAGFSCQPILIKDLRAGLLDFSSFDMIALSSGFSYGDVQGAGFGFAQTILQNPRLLETFMNFFERPQTLTLGVGNGAQMLMHFNPHNYFGKHLPLFTLNQSEKFEARLSMVELTASNSMLLKGMEGSKLPVITANTAGKAIFKHDNDVSILEAKQQLVCRYIDNYGQSTMQYPQNPVGSVGGICGVSSLDGRVTALMIQPERCFLSAQMSWHPSEWGRYSPWMRIFRNARVAFE